MPRQIVNLTAKEKQELKALVQKRWKKYRIRRAQILLNKEWAYDRIKEAYGASHSTISGVAKRFVMEGLEATLEKEAQKNRS